MTEVVQMISKQQISETSQYATKCNFMTVLVLKTQHVPPKKLKTSKKTTLQQKNQPTLMLFNFISVAVLSVK